MRRKWVFYSWSYFIDMIKDILPLCYKVFHNVQPHIVKYWEASYLWNNI